MNPTSDQFRKACSRFLTGITVATAIGTDGLPHGVTVNSFTSVSLEPPVILICVDCRAPFVSNLTNGQDFGINILEENQQELSRRFSHKEAERFAGIDWYLGKARVPLLPLVLATMECKLTAKIREGDHFLLIGRVLFANYREGNPLAYFQSSYRTLAQGEIAKKAISAAS